MPVMYGPGADQVVSVSLPVCMDNKTHMSCRVNLWIKNLLFASSAVLLRLQNTTLCYVQWCQRRANTRRRVQM